jgi:hypothetical protein
MEGGRGGPLRIRRPEAARVVLDVLQKPLLCGQQQALHAGTTAAATAAANAGLQGFCRQPHPLPYLLLRQH